MSRSSLIRCKYCGVQKRLLLHKDHGATPEYIAIFEKDGWMYKTKSRGICPNCNLFHKPERHHAK